MMTKGYSPDFQDAYDRRIQPKVKGLPIFQQWVDEFDTFINQSRIVKKEPLMNPTKQQIKALAFNAYNEGIENVSLEMSVKDKRTAKGYRMVYRDVLTGRFAKNPYKELE